MKKILVLLIIGLLVITGCSKTEEEQRKNKYADLNNKLVEELKNLKFGEDNYQMFLELTVADDNLLKTQLGLTLNDVENYVMALPMNIDSNFYIAIKPKKNSKEKVKNSIESYVSYIKQRIGDGTIYNQSTQAGKEVVEQKLNMLDNCLKKEVNGYYIYIVSLDNEKVFNILEENLKK